MEAAIHDAEAKLEVLEESLLAFPGALVLVTHDRYLLDRVSTHLLALDGRGGATTFADYAQWEATQRAQAAAALPEPGVAKPVTPKAAAGGKRAKLGYHEQREWEQIEARIIDAERQRDACREAAEDPAIASDHLALAERHDALAVAEAEVDRLYARWTALAAKVAP